MEQSTHPDLLLARAVEQLRITNELMGLFRKEGDAGKYAAGYLGWFNLTEEYKRTRDLLQLIDREVLEVAIDPEIVLEMNQYHDRLHAHYSRH